MSLGSLQADILGALQKLGKASAREVVDEVGKERKLAYTTVSTVLDRLYHKGLIKRSRKIGRGGVKYVYSYAATADERAGFVNRALDSLVSAFGPSVVPEIYQGLEQLTKEGVTEARKKVTKRK